MTRPSHLLAAHRAFLHALVRSLPQVRLYLSQAPALRLVPLPSQAVHLVHLRSHPAHLVSHHLRAVVLHPAHLHPAHLVSHPQALLAIRHSLQARRLAAHLQVAVLRSLLVAAHLHSHFLHQALHPVTQHFLPVHLHALHLHHRALVFKSSKGNIGIQIVMKAALRLLWWDLALVLLVESVTAYSDLDSLVVVVGQMIPGAIKEVMELSLDTDFQIQVSRE